MAGATSTGFRVCLGSEVFFSIGVAYLDSTYQKTHAVANVTFNERFTEAYLSYTKDAIKYGWPSKLTSPSSPNSIDASEETPGLIANWTKVSSTYPSFITDCPEYRSAVDDYLKNCCASVQQVIVTVDSKKTYTNSLLNITVIDACKDLFPNLKSHSLVFTSR